MTTTSSSTLSRPAPTDNEPIQPEKPGHRPYVFQEQLVRIVSARTEIPEKTVNLVVVALIDTIREFVGRGVEVRMSVLGTFFPFWQRPNGGRPGRWLAGLRISIWFFHQLNPASPVSVLALAKGGGAAAGKAWAPGERGDS